MRKILFYTEGERITGFRSTGYADYIVDGYPVLQWGIDSHLWMAVLHMEKCAEWVTTETGGYKGTFAANVSWCDEAQTVLEYTLHSMREFSQRHPGHVAVDFLDVSGAEKVTTQ